MTTQAAAACAGSAPTPLPLLTTELVAQGVGLRPRRESDAEFLREVYVAYRWPELAPTGWTPEACLAFLHDQYRLQEVYYGKYYDGAAWGVIEVGGERAGRLYLMLRKDDLRIVDIALLPAYRNRGIGGRLLKAIQDQAAGLGATKLSIHVEQSNPALRLYERLGFHLIEERPPYRLFEWRVDAQANTDS